MKSRSGKKRFLVCVYVLLFLVCAKMGFSYLYNEYMINRTQEEDGSFEVEPLLICNWIQPYLAHYNMGNSYYQEKNYEEAVAQYEEALLLNPGKERECDVRINLALAMIKSMGKDYDSEENRESSIETLKSARNILLENGCATEDGDGHNETSQELKKEIDEMLEELEEAEPSKPDDNKGDSDKPEEKEVGDKKEEDIKEELQQQQMDSYQERAEALQSYEEFEYEFNFDSDGRIW